MQPDAAAPTTNGRRNMNTKEIHSPANREIMSFKLNKDDLAHIGEVVSRLNVTSSGVDVANPGAFTIRNHTFNTKEPGAFTIRNHTFDVQKPGAYAIRNYQFSSK
jgi:hypothetical protein